MVDVCYTLTCDRCRRYLMFENQTVAEFGDLESLLDCAERHGWLLIGAKDEEPAEAFCAHCATKAVEPFAAPTYPDSASSIPTRVDNP